MMLSILKSIRARVPFIWIFIEWMNSQAISIFYWKKIKITTQRILCSLSSDYEYRLLEEVDLLALCTMLMTQPENFNRFFKPHEFDLDSLRRLYKNRSFLMLGTFDGDKIIGYFFIRFFINRKAFRGKMVDANYQGKGIAKKMGILMTEIALGAGFRLFATISRENLSSLASSKAVNRIRVVEELKDNYLYVEYLPKA